MSILVEGQSQPLSHLAQQISTLLSGSIGGAAADTPSNTEAGTSHSQAAAPADGAGSEGVSQLVVRNIIQDVASRKSYGLQDGEP